MWLYRGVARKAGFKESARAIDMIQVSDEDFERVVLEHDIFGVTPEQKQKMVSILQETVAMSGDGQDVSSQKKQTSVLL